ncbi:MAG: hypothetical protein NWE88_09260 [Candidatus Bathyarchaeota archaeon]|nr:hypothetical protein [Candidatus Bathyarchaeota archaeon]
MNKLSKRAISIIVIATFLISMIPIMPASALTLDSAAPTAGTRYLVGDTITVEGWGVTSGATINVYWDFVTSAGLMNNTQGAAGGTFTVSLDVPDTFAGEHWIWVKDVETSLTANVRVVVLPEVDLSASSGLVDEELTVDGTGYLDDDDIAIYFGSPPVRLDERYGDSTADWATDPVIGGTEDVVKLVGVDGSNAAALVMNRTSNAPTLVAFDESLTGLSIYYTKSVATGLSPEIALLFAHPDCVNPYDSGSNNRAHVEITIPTTTNPTTAWQIASIATGTVWWFGNKADGSSFSGTSADWGTAVSDIDTASGGSDSWVLSAVGPQVGWGVVGTYYVDDVKVEGIIYNLTSPDATVTSGDDGSWSSTFDIPDLAETGHSVSGVGSGDFWNMSSFTIGAVITTDIDQGPTGFIVTITGRGFIDGFLSSVKLDGTDMLPVDGDVDEIEVTEGEFEAEFVIPDVAMDDYDITVDDGAKTAKADFEVDGEPEIEVDPTYGSPGAVITVTGTNFTQIAGTEVYVTLDSTPTSDLVTAETDANGNFEATFVAPAVGFITYTVTAVDEYFIDADDAFKVGLIALIVNPISGAAGTEMAITGIGFENGLYNLTFGDELYEDYTDGVGSDGVTGEAISDIFYIPNIDPGTYEVMVIDSVENELTVHFTVTESSYASADPAMAPNEYNITFSGNNFADVDDLVELVIYNSTDDWPMDVRMNGDPGVPVETDDGNFTGWWEVLDELSIGEYTINITGSEGLLVQLPFSVVAARVEVNPTKALFDRGNTVKFDISNDFDLPNSYIEIYSPDDTLWWITDLLVADMWIQPDLLYTVPYYRQTANENPMDLASDAPLGTWTYFFYDTADDELMNGTFAVGPSTAAQVDVLLEDVRSDLSGLAEDMAGLSDDFADDMDALSADFADDIASLSADFADDIDGLSDEIAAATDAGNAASDAVADLEDSFSDLEDSMGDIADASNSALDAAQEAADAAADAATAAEGAGDAAKGLESLVYGAIGASLIAALAAIVSLMQISKKIAG